MRPFLALLFSASSLFAQADYSTLLLLDATSAPSTPAFGTNVANGFFSSGATTYVVPITNAVSAGETILILHFRSDAYDASSITDSQGNTYSFVTNQTPFSNYRFTWYQSTVTTGLGLTDTITINYSTSDFRRLSVLAIKASGIAGVSSQLDSVGSLDYFGTAPTINFTTTATATLAFAGLTDVGSSRAYTAGSGWASAGPAIDHNGSLVTFVYQVYSTAGSKSLNGTYAAPNNGVEAAVAIFK